MSIVTSPNLRRKIGNQLAQSRFMGIVTPQQQLCIKTISIHSSTEVQHLKEILLGNEPIVLIARISPIVSKDPEMATKLVNELYSIHVKNNYSLFRLGGERLMIVPDNVQVDSIL